MGLIPRQMNGFLFIWQTRHRDKYRDFKENKLKILKQPRGVLLGLISSLEKEQTEHEIAIVVRPVASVGTPVVLSPESSRTFAIAFICVRVSGPRGRSAAFATLIPWRSKLICRRRSGVGQVVRAFPWRVKLFGAVTKVASGSTWLCVARVDHLRVVQV